MLWINKTEHAQSGHWFPLFLFVLIAILLMVDIAGDLSAGTTVFHILTEFLLFLAAAVGAIYFWNRLRVARQVEKDLKQDLERARAETTHWQEEERDLLYDLRKAVNKQFSQWGFSSTDREVAFYLLNGLSFKEIAEKRGTTAQTVKQQAYLLYRKAGLKGRAELSAFFLGGLLQPDATGHKATSKSINTSANLHKSSGGTE